MRGKENPARSFQKEFKVDNKGSAELLISSSYLMGTGDELRSNLAKVIKPSLDHFTEVQATSTNNILDGICADDTTGMKRAFADQVQSILRDQFETKDGW